MKLIHQPFFWIAFANFQFDATTFLPLNSYNIFLQLALQQLTHLHFQQAQAITISGLLDHSIKEPGLNSSGTSFPDRLSMLKTCRGAQIFPVISEFQEIHHTQVPLLFINCIHPIKNLISHIYRQYLLHD